jgi:hypothetical protein
MFIANCMAYCLEGCGVAVLLFGVSFHGYLLDSFALKMFGTAFYS